MRFVKQRAGNGISNKHCEAGHRHSEANSEAGSIFSVKATMNCKSRMEFDVPNFVKIGSEESKRWDDERDKDTREQSVKDRE